MARGRVWAVAGVVVALCVGGLALRQRTELSPEQGVRQGVQQFVDGVNTWKLPEAMRVLAPEFKTGGEVRRGDVSRWLFQARRDWDRLSIYVAGEEVTVAPDGQTATAQTDISMSGRRHAGREESVGEDKPVRILSYWRRDGRHWLCYGADNVVGTKLDGFWFE